MSPLPSFVGQSPEVEHRRGVLHLFAGVLLLIPDATLTRLVDLGAMSKAAWRLSLVSLGMTVILLLRYGRALPRKIFAPGLWGLAVSFFTAAPSVIYCFALDHTMVANVVLIMATSPFWAALLQRVLLGTPVAKRTLVAMPVVFGGVAVAVGGGRFDTIRAGDVAALGVPILGAARRTIMRAHPDVDMFPSMLLGNMLIGAGLVLSGVDMRLAPSDVAPLLAMGLVFLPCGQALVASGTRRVCSAESSLIMCLETAVSPILAAVVLREPLHQRTLLGGAIVVAAIVSHALSGRATAGPMSSLSLPFLRVV